MPQTREHLAILKLLGIRGGVVALTKRDLVDDDWLELVRLDVADALTATPLANAAVVPTSAVSGHGLAELRAALAETAARIVPRPADDIFRMPIDRVFTVRGTGTVVTGTVWSGRVNRDDTVRLLPDDRPLRVRGLQAHGNAVDSARPGTRLAVALAGIDHDALARGAVLVADEGWHPTRVVRADVTLLAGSATVLSPRAVVRFHLGTTEVGARVVTPGGPLSGGETKPARVVLDAPIVARAGDRFVIRGGSPLGTLGGGVVVDPNPSHRRARPWSGPRQTGAERLALVLTEVGGNGLAVGDLPVRIGISPTEVVRNLESPGLPVVRIGRRIYALAERERVVAAIIRLINAHHERYPLDPGATLQTVRAQLTGHPELIDDALQVARAEGLTELDGGIVRRPGWLPRLSSDQQRLKTALIESLRSAGAEPPSLSELGAAHGPAVAPLLRILEREGVVVPVETDRYYARDAVDSLIARLRSGTDAGREYSPSELRDVIGISRKYLIPFLEFCDRTGVTERRPAGRVIHRG